MSLLGLLVFSACSLEEKDFTEVEKGKFMRNAGGRDRIDGGLQSDDRRRTLPLSSFTVVHTAH